MRHFLGLDALSGWKSVVHSTDPVPAWREKARLNANEPLRLQPDLPEGHLARGYSYYYGDRDYERALAEFEIARRGLPNESPAYFAIGAIQRRQGQWAESSANLEKAATLDPKNATLLNNLAFSYMALRNFEAADKAIDRVIAAAPQSLQVPMFKGVIAVLGRGDFSVAEKQLPSLAPESDPDGLMTWAGLGFRQYNGNFPTPLPSCKDSAVRH
jgi:tetratricopeptide (TPR) repeat protein